MDASSVRSDVISSKKILSFDRHDLEFDLLRHFDGKLELPPMHLLILHQVLDVVKVWGLGQG